MSVRDASDLQFDTWAKSRIEIQGPDGPWPMEERVKLCDMLWHLDRLVMLKKEGEE